MGGPLPLDALGPAGAYRPRTRTTVTDVTGRPVAELGLVPRLFVDRAVSALRRATEMPEDERVAAIARAGEAFASGTVAGLPAEEHQRLVSRVSGLPVAVVRAAAAHTARAAADVHRAVRLARPAAAVDDWRDPLTRTGRAVWTRRGDVLAVHAAGNHPGVHTLWLQALALGYRIAVRPSTREPLTPHRLVTALRDAGFPADHLVLLPTAHEVADAVLDGADLGVVYGGDDVTRRYAGSSRVLAQGPGRSKILLTADADPARRAGLVVDSVVREGGTGCVNATAVLVEGDPAPLAEAAAERLAAIPGLPPQDDRATLPVQPVDTARALERHLLEQASGTTAWLGADGVVEELGDGSAVLRPAVHQVGGPDAPQLGVEMPFPCVWVAPWHREAGIAPLRGSLVVTAVTEDEKLIDALLAEPTVGSLHLGASPTCDGGPDMPHDGFLAEFLMRTKGVLRPV
ncbi:aldehyde dehydrogenase family protein [Streptomyces albireticuli]|uniref:aldehyde dehydrogenase family protein n=1 Tax=Streptomyces albireticuli TaxID=1940 RepID=UPI0036ACFAE0